VQTIAETPEYIRRAEKLLWPMTSAGTCYTTWPRIHELAT
jgi:hypothetical protein